MTAFSSLAQTVAATALRSSRLMFTALAASALSLAFAATVSAQTGDPQTNAFGWTPNSTNALNYAEEVPGRVGQAAPYVLFNSNAPGEVTLDFHNPGPGLAFFEYRIDGIPSSGTAAHPVVLSDVQHPGRAVSTLTERLGETFTATNYVDVRLALGGERDWDFDWVRFEVQPVPAPVEATSIPTLSAYGLGFTVLGLSLVAFRRLRMSAKRTSPE